MRNITKMRIEERLRGLICDISDDIEFPPEDSIGCKCKLAVSFTIMDNDVAGTSNRKLKNSVIASLMLAVEDWFYSQNKETENAAL